MLPAAHLPPHRPPSGNKVAAAIRIASLLRRLRVYGGASLATQLCGGHHTVPPRTARASSWRAMFFADELNESAAMFWFRKRWTLRGMRFADEFPIWEVELDYPSKCFVRLREVHIRRDPDLECEVEITRNLSADVLSGFECLANGTVPEFERHREHLPYEVGSEIWIDTKGNVTPGRALPFDWLPATMQDAIHSADTDMQTGLNRFVRTLRWRQNAAGPPRPYATRKSEWSLNGISWHNTPGRLYARVIPSDPIWATDSQKNEVEALLKSRVSEPVAHELLREAIAISSTTRSALVIACAALETGVKGHIARLMPEAEWLVTNLPSPPVERILQDYLPQIHERRGISDSPFPLPQVLARFLKRQIACRNDVIHGREASTDFQDLDDLLGVIEDLLYVLDYCEGQDWGRNFVSKEMCDLFGWPNRADQFGLRMRSVDRPWLGKS